MDWRYDKLMAIIASQQLLIPKIIKYRLHFGFEELTRFCMRRFARVLGGDSWTANKT